MYGFDDIRECAPVCLRATSEVQLFLLQCDFYKLDKSLFSGTCKLFDIVLFMQKPERRLFFTIHAEGAIKASVLIFRELHL